MSIIIWKIHDSVRLFKQYLQKKTDHVYERPSENGLKNNMSKMDFLKIWKKK